MKRLWILAGIAALLAACAPASPAAQDGVLNVVATTGMIADVAQNIGGDHVRMTALMGAGVDPHLYRATESDVGTLNDADVIFYNGLDLEARMEDVLAQPVNGQMVVAVAEVIPVERRLTKADSDAADPHVWMDVQLWALVAGRIRDALAERDPANADAYRAGADAYLRQLADLDAYVRAQIATIPAAQRVLITSHDAFQYYGRAYGIEVYAPQGISTVTDAGVDDIRRIVDIIVERGVPAIFIETSVSPQVINAVQEGARARGVAVTIGGTLFSDAMGDAGTPGGTYLGMIRSNTDTMVAALTGGTAGATPDA